MRGESHAVIRVAHISDPHLPIDGRPAPYRLVNKRAIGWLSWRHRRSRVHRQHVLDALAFDLAAMHVDHLVVTGDLGNISLPAEFEAAGRWLSGHGDPASVTVIPGNHDAYVGRSWSATLAHWAPFMTGDGGSWAAEPSEATQFPFVRRRPPIALIGLCSAIPTPPGFASGKLGRRQRGALADILRQLGGEGLFRILMLHHPPVSDGVSPLGRLADARALAEMIAAHGAELILHGHNHRFQVHSLPGPLGPVPVIGAPSASAIPRPGKHAGGYCVYDIDPVATDSAFRITLRSCHGQGERFEATRQIQWSRVGVRELLPQSQVSRSVATI